MPHSSRCWVHLTNAATWENITGYPPPHEAASTKTYVNAGLPWFDYYSETPAIGGSKKLAGVKSISEFPVENEDAFEPGFVSTIHKKDHSGEDSSEEEVPF
ncbi:MAG: hypothetical protein EA353_06120 [Puniceicoccaceae bacterium]|nr:MAG: hypothetical protein EA353_06120 [Puniceicoccaceae bacterium]